MNKKYPPFAFVGSIIVQWWLWSRSSNIVKDADYSNSWYFQNVGLVGLALLLLAPVLRHGVAWQRLVAGVLCVFPLFLVVDGFYECVRALTQE